MQGMHCGGKCFVDQEFGRGFVFQGFEINKRTNCLSNDLVCGFDDCICCWCMWSDIDSFDAGTIKRELKIVTMKFRAVIMNKLLWARASS